MITRSPVLSHHGHVPRILPFFNHSPVKVHVRSTDASAKTSPDPLPSTVGSGTFSILMACGRWLGFQKESTSNNRSVIGEVLSFCALLELLAVD
jgi:hypothetical protein